MIFRSDSQTYFFDHLALADAADTPNSFDCFQPKSRFRPSACCSVALLVSTLNYHTPPDAKHTELEYLINVYPALFMSCLQQCPALDATTANSPAAAGAAGAVP
jgi:hypothetical protein